MTCDVNVISRIKAEIPVGETKLVKAIAGKLRLSMKRVIEEVEGSHDGLDLLVGVKAGSGHAPLRRADWEIEHYQA
jgi:hypothetical protein